MEEKRKHNYVVGFSGIGQCVYGKGNSYNNIDLMTLFQAKRRVKELYKGRRVKRRIYKLVPVEEID